MDKYIPPFTINNTMLEYVSNIMEKIGKLDNFSDLNKMPMLRRNNQIKSIHSSLAIEANSLSLEQVRSVINGKMVVGSRKEIQEVKNAYKAYENLAKINPYSLEDLKKTHGIIMNLILDDAGNFRDCEEGVFDGDKCIFMAPPKSEVNRLMEQLFIWMEDVKNKLHPLILSSVFHYEFVFIHPFKDGNGRIARLWQNVILSKWKEIFEFLPIESQIKEYQDEYYKAISECHKNGNSNIFIEFMLKMIDKVLNQLIADTQNQRNIINRHVYDLLEVMEFDMPMSANEIMEKLNIKSKETFRKNYIDPALKLGLIKMTEPDKPTSKNQMYYKS